MSDSTTQSFANHVRFDPLFHFVSLPIFVFAFIWSIVHVVRHPNFHNAGLVLVFFAAVIITFKARLYALKVQTRVIRLEERLRLLQLISEPLRTRIPELTESQLVALRFASDAECPALVEKALADKLDNKTIKKAVGTWRADFWRV
jgi:hypothetical protein